jgi:alpha-glucuronidase
MKKTCSAFLFVLLLVPAAPALADDGYRLWLGFNPVTDRAYLKECERRFENVMITGTSPVLRTAHDEFIAGLAAMTGMRISEVNSPEGRGTLIAGTFTSSPFIASLLPDAVPGATGEEGYIIRSVRQGRRTITVVASEGERGVMYGIFHLLRVISTESPLDNLDIREQPATGMRLLNHWDNLDGSVERDTQAAPSGTGICFRDIFHPGTGIMQGQMPR